MGARVVADNSAAIVRRLTDRIAAATAKVAFDIEAESKAEIQTGRKSGRIYKRKKRFHQASAPGEAPATDTGNLVNSGFTRKVNATKYRVGYTAAYAKTLEKTRPFLMPVFRRKKAEYLRVVRRIVKG